MTIPCPEFEWVEEIDQAVIQTSPEGGAVMRGFLHDVPLRRFHLGWSKATEAEKDDLRDEWVTACGSAFTTTYTPTPRGEVAAVTVRMRGFQMTLRGLHYEMTCTLEEQWTPY